MSLQPLSGYLQAKCDKGCNDAIVATTYLTSLEWSPSRGKSSHLESFGSRRARDQIYDRLIIPKWFTAPIRGYEREQPVFNLVPLAGARRKVTDGNRKARFIR